MAKASWNLSDRIFFTINYTNGTATIGHLDGDQEILVEFTSDELKNLTKALVPDRHKLTKVDYGLLKMMVNWALEYIGMYQMHLYDSANRLAAKVLEVFEEV